MEQKITGITLKTQNTSGKTRNWCFTLNNYSEQDWSTMTDYFGKHNCYCIMAREIGRETQTNHIQGYVEFPNPRCFSGLKKVFPKVHWEMRYSSADDCIKYCKKDGNFIEIGQRGPGQGSRSDLNAVRVLINEGKGMKDVCEVTTSFQQLRFAETMLKYTEKKRDFKPLVYWVWGPSGSGKSRAAFREAPNAWVSGKNLKWWEGYDAHEEVIIDDFRADFCTFHELLRILDRYEYRVEVKGGSRQLLAKTIWITSIFRPHDAYKTLKDDEPLYQLLRRIDCIYTVGPDGILCFDGLGMQTRLIRENFVREQERESESNTSVSPTFSDI